MGENMSYSLKEISEWQKEVSGQESKISLPSLQRGFVWKPSQIEALWDSIFRGYPIGAIMMSIDEKENRFDHFYEPFSIYVWRNTRI